MANSNRGGGSFCSAINCQNTRKKGWRLFSFPKDEERCKIWVEKCRRQDLIGKPVSYLRANCCLCAAHFEPSQFMNPENPNCRLIWSAVPSIFDFNNNNTSPKAKRKRKVSGTVDASTCEFNDKGDDEAGESTDITTEFVMGDEDARAAIIDENKKTVISDKKKKKKKRKSAEVDSTITKAERAMTADSEEAEEPEPDMSEDKDTESAVADQDTVSTVLDEDKESTFKDLGVVDILCEACERLQWKRPSKIQKEAIPLVLSGQDVVGLAETGSGKTAAFALPIIQALLDKPQRFFAVVLTPTRELAYQISEQFTALGSSIGLKCAVIVGGLDMYDQALMLAKKPHVIVATPGRLVDHLENTKGFNLKTVKFLVMDEADRILSMDFGDELDKIVQVIPKDRRTLMFSATMTRKVQKLQRASLNNPVKVEINSKYKTVDTLVQSYLFVPIKFKDVYLVYVLNELAGNSFMVFCSTCNTVNRLSLMLRNLGFGAIPIYGAMTQDKRLGSLNKFKSQQSSILICTDVASRGLDMPHVDVVINFDIPTHTKDYIHRVGRTARAGRAGKALTFVTQYDIELYKRIEELIKKQLPLYKTEEAEVMQFMERVNEAQRYTKITMKGEEEMRTEKKKRKMTQYGNDSEESSGMRKKFRKKSNKY